MACAHGQIVAASKALRIIFAHSASEEELGLTVAPCVAQMKDETEGTPALITEVWKLNHSKREC